MLTFRSDLHYLRTKGKVVCCWRHSEERIMGANCCVASKEKSSPNGSSPNVRASPSWSFRWDKRTHIEDIMDRPAQFSHGSRIGSEEMSGEVPEREVRSDGDGRNGQRCSSSVLDRSEHVESNRKTGIPDNLKFKLVPGRANGSNSLPEIKGTSNSSVSGHRVPDSVPLALSSSAFKADPSSIGKGCHSHRFLLCRQVSESGMRYLKTRNSSFSAEGSKSSSAFSVCSNDVFAGELQGGSSDSIMRPEKKRWSLDREVVGSVSHKMTESASERIGQGEMSEEETCRVCSKSMKNGSPSKGGSELPVVAVLVCGHVYHADCLVAVTPENDKYDPPCPACSRSIILPAKMEAKIKKRLSRNAVPGDGDRNMRAECLVRQGMDDPAEMGSRGTRKNASVLLRRHFSLLGRSSSRKTEVLV